MGTFPFDSFRPEPLRIIQVVNVRWFNATAWYGLFLSTLLREAGHEVRVLCLPDTDSFDKARAMGLEPEGVPLNSGNPLAIPGLLRRLGGIIREFRPHIVNCHRGESFLLWGMLQKSGCFGLVRTRGDQRPPKTNYPNIALYGKVADAVIATSTGIAESLRSNLHVPENRLHIIFGGVDTRCFFPDAEGRARMRDAWGLDVSHRAVGLVGRFDAVKGQKEMIASFARFLSVAGPDASRYRLVLAGFATSSTSEETVRGWVSDAGIASNVIFPGRCEPVRELMSALDLGVVASLGSETIARVALEIMACGVPLAGTRVGVMPDLLEAQALVPPGDTEAMAAILARFATDGVFERELLATQKNRMRTLRERDFLDQTLAVYQGVAGKRCRPDSCMP